MELSRRDFIKLSGVTTGGLFLPAGITGAALAQAKPFPLHKPIGETPTICPFCAVGCGAIVAAQDNRVLNIEGDPDHPVDCDVLVCGDDKEARATVIDVISDLGLRGVDAGVLKNAVALESLTPVLLHINRRYKSVGSGIRITGIPESE